MVVPTNMFSFTFARFSSYVAYKRRHNLADAIETDCHCPESLLYIVVIIVQNAKNSTYTRSYRHQTQRCHSGPLPVVHRTQSEVTGLHQADENNPFKGMD